MAKARCQNYHVRLSEWKSHSMESRSKTMITAFVRKESRHFIYIWIRQIRVAFFACWLSSLVIAWDTDAEHEIVPLVCTCIWSGKLNVLVSDVSDFTRLLILRSVTYSIYQATWNKKCWQQKCDEVVSFNADFLFDGGSKVFDASTISA